MRKRFIDISTLPKAWRKLNPSLKLAWFYLWNHCDPAGVWEIDSDLFEFENGFELNVQLLKYELGDLIEFNDEIILLTNFISVNQCDLSKLRENYNPHKPVFRSINKYKLKLNPSLNQVSLKLVVGVEVEVEVKDEVVNFGKSENLLSLDDKFVTEVAEFFGQDQINRKERLLIDIQKLSDLESFKLQFEGYKKYISILGKKYCKNWSNYLIEWDYEDWASKANNLKSKNLKSMTIVGSTMKSKVAEKLKKQHG